MGKRYDVRLVVRVEGGELELSFDEVPGAVMRDVLDLLAGWSEPFQGKEPSRERWKRWGRTNRATP